MPGPWQCVATPYGGTVTSLASASHSRLVFAAPPVGVYRSSDGGSHWVLPATVSPVPLASPVAVSPGFERDHTVCACGVDGLYRSSDCGATWQRVLIGDGIRSVVAG